MADINKVMNKNTLEIPNFLAIISERKISPAMMV
jgi:hypothetical protein